MNGRLYDASLGRMLSADPVVQEMYNQQNLNRYSYVLNNPLSYTDPTGLSFVKKYWRQIVSLANTIFAPYLGAWTTTWWGAMTIGFAAGAVSTGSLQGGLWGAFSAGIFAGIGAGFSNVAASNMAAGPSATALLGNGLTAGQFAAKIVAHAVAGGVMSSLQGGKFGSGFVAAGTAQALSRGVDRIDAAKRGFSGGRVAAAALVGGTASVLSGGKFANGAVTAAFSRAFNDEMHDRWMKRQRIALEDYVEWNKASWRHLWGYSLGVLEGGWSVAEGNAYAVRFVLRGVGLMGPDHFDQFQAEGQIMDEVAHQLSTNPEARAELKNGLVRLYNQTNFLDARLEGYLIGRVGLGGFLFPLGISAMIGDGTYAVERGVRDPAEILLRGADGRH